MYNKIQPEQIEIHTFSSPSGSISFTKGSNYIYGNLSNNLTGNFNITGSLIINGSNLYLTDNTNSYTATNNVILGGKSNTISAGTGNAIINSTGSIVNGKNNLDLNSLSSIFNSTSKFCTVLAGKGNSTNANISGSAIISDFSNTSTIATTNNKFYVSFTNGTDFKGNVEVNNNLLLNASSNLLLHSNASAIFSGDATFLGDVSGISSFNNSISILNAGLDKIILGSGASNTVTITNSAPTSNKIYNIPDVGGNCQFLMTTGSQTVGGIKTFTSPPIANGIFLGNTGSNTISITNSIPSSNRIYNVPEMSGNCEFLMTTGSQTVGGSKRFTSTPTVNGAKIQTGSIYQNKFLTANTAILTGSTLLISSDALPDSGMYLINATINLSHNNDDLLDPRYCDLFLYTGNQKLYSQRIIIGLGNTGMISQNFSTIATGYVGTQFNLSGISSTGSFTAVFQNSSTPSSNLCVIKIADIY
jgi:hypothetical protein